MTNRTNPPQNIVMASLLCKTYEAFEAKIEVLKDVDMTVEEGNLLS